VGKNQLDEPRSVPSRWPLDRAEKPSLTSPRFRYCHFGLFRQESNRLIHQTMPKMRVGSA
jgi:hypothetical protein